MSKLSPFYDRRDGGGFLIKIVYTFSIEAKKKKKKRDYV